jgi:hypothetical protein
MHVCKMAITFCCSVSLELYQEAYLPSWLWYKMRRTETTRKCVLRKAHANGLW